MTATMTDHDLWTPSIRRIERYWAVPHWHCYLQVGNHIVVRRACGTDHRTQAVAQRCARRQADTLNRRQRRHNPTPAPTTRRLSVRPPADRAEALCDLETAFALAMHAMGCDDDPGLREVTVRQLRCDLHTLGVTTAELDAADLR